MGKTENAARLWRLFDYCQRPLCRWGLSLAWTIITVSLMLSPAGDGTTVSTVSGLFGGTQITDAIGHVILNSVLVLLWCWTISLYLPEARAMRLVLVVGLLWGFSAEMSQHFVPGRGVSLLDFTANALAVLIGLVGYQRFRRLGTH